MPWDSRFAYSHKYSNILNPNIDFVARFLRKSPSESHATKHCGFPLILFKGTLIIRGAFFVGQICFESSRLFYTVWKK